MLGWTVNWSGLEVLSQLLLQASTMLKSEFKVRGEKQKNHTPIQALWQLSTLGDEQF